MNRQLITNEIIDNINTLKRALHASMQPLQLYLSLSSSQIEMFFTIAHVQPTGTKQLADQLHLTAGAVSQLVDGLVRLDLVERSTDAHDRRKQHLQLTPHGKTEIGRIKQQRQEVFQQIMEIMTDDELVAWRNLQTKLINHLTPIIKPNTKEKDN